jgi:hypothetical protein
MVLEANMTDDIGLEMTKFLNEIYKIKKNASEEDGEKESVKDELSPFDEGYDYFKGGGFARAYRSKEDPSKVRLKTRGDYSRTILSNISEDNPYIPKVSEMSQYTDLEKNIRVYDMQYYPKLDEYTSAFLDFIELTNTHNDAGLHHKCIAHTAENGTRLSDYLEKNPEIPQKLYEAILLIENEIIKSDHDFWWDFNFPNFAMKEDVEGYDSQLILLDPLSPCGGKYNQRNDGSGELIVPDEIIIASVRKKLIKLADMLDLKKMYKEADMVDKIIFYNKKYVK